VQGPNPPYPYWRQALITPDGHVPVNAPFFDGAAGILTGDHFTPLPWSDKTYAAAW
jgi:hypothetical protein